MRMLAAIATSIILASVAPTGVFVTVYRCDGTTPVALKDPNTLHVYSDVMVGTRLVLVVSSDKPWKDITGWLGGLQLTRDDWERGKLLGRGYDPNNPDPGYQDSCLPAAGVPNFTFGIEPTVIFLEYLGVDSSYVGFQLTTLGNAFAGDWFVLDYVAEKVGSCSVGLYDYWLSLDVPQETLTFNQVPSRDFDGNGIVDFADFASLAAHWRQQVDPSAIAVCPDDLDSDQVIGPRDLAMFSDYWLERTDCSAQGPKSATSAGGL